MWIFTCKNTTNGLCQAGTIKRQNGSPYILVSKNTFTITQGWSYRSVFCFEPTEYLEVSCLTGSWRKASTRRETPASSSARSWTRSNISTTWESSTETWRYSGYNGFVSPLCRILRTGSVHRPYLFTPLSPFSFFVARELALLQHGWRLQNYDQWLWTVKDWGSRQRHVHSLRYSRICW